MLGVVCLGGDQGSVTLMGQSAGSSSTMYHLMSPRFEPFIRSPFINAVERLHECLQLRPLGLDRTGHMSFLTGQDRTPKFGGQVLPDRTESGLIFLNILPAKVLKVRCPGRKSSSFWTVRILKICQTSGQDMMSGRALNDMVQMGFERLFFR